MVEKVTYPKKLCLNKLHDKVMVLYHLWARLVLTGIKFFEMQAVLTLETR